MAEFNGFLGSMKQTEPVGSEREKQFLCGILALLCNRPSEGFDAFSSLAKEDAAAAFNCALCFYIAKDYSSALKFLEDVEKLLHLFEKTTPKQPIPSLLLQYETQSDGYLLPMLQNSPKRSPERAMKQLLRVKADILYALGREEELKKLLPLLSGEGFENIENIKNEMRNCI